MGSKNEQGARERTGEGRKADQFAHLGNYTLTLDSTRHSSLEENIRVRCSAFYNKTHKLQRKQIFRALPSEKLYIVS